ncbi:MAG: glycosyltransferase [Candidatus Bruticola sp.]
MAIEFSLIIPTYNRIGALRHCLKHIERLNFPKNQFEVVLIDDGSQDETSELKAEDYPFNMKVLHQTNSGTAAARNRGIKEAEGLFCMFVDDDVMLHPDLLLEHQRLHLAEPNLVVRGPVINFSALPCPLDSDEELLQSARTASQELHASACRLLAASSPAVDETGVNLSSANSFLSTSAPRSAVSAQKCPFFSRISDIWKLWSGQNLSMLKHFSMNYLCTSNASLYKHHLIAAGLFDTSFPRWEDAELAVRLKRLGLKRRFSLNAIVYHLKPPETWEARIRTAQKDGFSAAELYLRYPSFMMRLRSGLHFANSLRNGFFTKGPWKELLADSACGRSTVFPQKFAQETLIEKAYLEAGFARLKRTQQS